MLWRHLGSPAASETAALDFTDAGSVSAWAQDALCWAVENGVISGKVDPAGLTSRTEAAQVLNNFTERR